MEQEIRIHFVSGEHIDVTGAGLGQYDAAIKNPDVRLMWAVNKMGKPVTINVAATTHAEELAD